MLPRALRQLNVGSLIRGSCRYHKGLQTLNELLWKRVEFPEEQCASDNGSKSQQKDDGGSSRSSEGDTCSWGWDTSRVRFNHRYA